MPPGGPNGIPRNGPRTRAKMENETLLMMDERKEQDQDDELDKNATSNEEGNPEDQDQDQDQQQDENPEPRLDHDDLSS